MKATMNQTYYQELEQGKSKMCVQLSTNHHKTNPAMIPMTQKEILSREILQEMNFLFFFGEKAGPHCVLFFCKISMTKNHQFFFSKQYFNKFLVYYNNK